MLAAFHTILVAVDGDRGGLDAVALTARLAGPEAAVVRSPVLTASARAVAAALHDLVDAHGADLLVIGAGHHRHLTLRSHDHARAAVRELPCAVAVAPAQYAARPREVIRSIGVGYVDDRAGRVVLDTARSLAWQLGAEIHATTVVPPSNWETSDSAVGWRAAAAAQRMAEIPGVHGMAVEGDPIHALAALSLEVDLLVIASRHHNALRRLAPDIAGGLSHAAHCPLLVLPHPPARG